MISVNKNCQIILLNNALNSDMTDSGLRSDKCDSERNELEEYKYNHYTVNRNA